MIKHDLPLEILEGYQYITERVIILISYMFSFSGPTRCAPHQSFAHAGRLLLEGEFCKYNCTQFGQCYLAMCTMIMEMFIKV